MDPLSIKEKKELFVSGLNGTSVTEISVIVGILPFINLAKVFVLCLCPVVLIKNQILRFFLDFFVLIIPTILFITELSVFINTFFSILVAFEIYMFMVLTSKRLNVRKEEKIDFNVSNNSREKLNKESSEDDLTLENSKKLTKPDMEEMDISELIAINVLSTNLPFLKWFRSIISIVTCICILAVDFHVFPRRLAKTELFGTGLMDVGVGFYVVSNALVCREARIGQTKAYVSIRQKQNYLHFSALLFQLISSWPIVLLGLVRLITVKSLDYQEHVSEYGVHWNFFFTLAFVKSLASIVLFFMNSKHCLVASILIGICYQFVLSSKYIDATSILTNSDRNGFLMQNKEGLASCVGFLSLYFAGVHLGSFLFKSRSNLHEWLVASVKLFMVSLVLWILLYYCQVEIQPISRRLSNIAYVLWLLALTSFLISVAMGLDVVAYWYISKNYLPLHSKADNWLVFDHSKISEKKDFSPPSPALCLLSAVSRNQLLYFLVSNLMTGIINNAIDTMAYKNVASLIILCLYQFIITSFIWYLHCRQITFKFW